MKIIKISYQNETFKVQLTRMKAFPNDVFKINFEEYPQLVEVMESPVYIIEKPDRLSYSKIQNTKQVDLLKSFTSGIEDNHSII